MSKHAKIGDKIWIFRIDDNVIIPAKITKTYRGSDEIWWEPVDNASNGKWLICSHRTAAYFHWLDGAKMHALIMMKLEKEAVIAKFDKAIVEIESFGKINA